MEQEISKRKKMQNFKYMKLNSLLLNIQWVKKEIKKEDRKYLQTKTKSQYTKVFGMQQNQSKEGSL